MHTFPAFRSFATISIESLKAILMLTMFYPSLFLFATISLYSPCNTIYKCFRRNMIKHNTNTVRKIPMKVK